MTFLERPLSAGLLFVALILMLIAILPTIRKSREQVFQEAD
jgi:putative tricarboxylic transport membrane protein